MAGSGADAGATVTLYDNQWEVSGGCESGNAEFLGIDNGVTLSVGISESDGPAGNFSDPDLGFALLIPVGAPVTEFDSNDNGFTISGQVEGSDYAIDVRCGG